MRASLVVLSLASLLACGGEASGVTTRPTATIAAAPAPPTSAATPTSTAPETSTAPAPSTAVDPSVVAAPPSPAPPAPAAPVAGSLRIVLVASHELLGSERASVDALAELLRGRGADVTVELADGATTTAVQGWSTAPIGAWPAQLAGIETAVVLPLAPPTTREDGQRVGAGVGSDVLVARAGAAEPRLRVQLEPGAAWPLDASLIDRVVGPAATGRVAR
ncbi:MAG: hypothetical protein U0234_28105 [Sandaracinus sp.]